MHLGQRDGCRGWGTFQLHCYHLPTPGALGSALQLAHVYCILTLSFAPYVTLQFESLLHTCFLICKMVVYTKEMACVAHIAQGLWTCSKLLNSQSHFHFDSQNQLLVPYYFSYFTGEETSQAGPGFCRQSVAESRPLDVRTGLFCLLTGVTTLPWPQPLLLTRPPFPCLQSGVGSLAS